MAGMNAHFKIREQAPFVLERSEAYIGVLIDDLVTKGTDEPYRMFTSRAEYRILLRQDNADERLTPRSHALGLASDERMRGVEDKLKSVKSLRSFLTKTSAVPREINPVLAEINSAPIPQKVKLDSLITRPHMSLDLLKKGSATLAEHLANTTYAETVLEGTEVLMKYEGYIQKEQEMAEKQARLENIPIPNDLEFNRLTSLSAEARIKLTKAQPRTIAHASRISGVSPADISVLLVYLGR